MVTVNYQWKWANEVQFENFVRDTRNFLYTLFRSLHTYSFVI